MVRKNTGLTPGDEIRLFRHALDLEGLRPGTEIPRQLMEDMIIATFDVSSRMSMTQKLRVGSAHRLWRVTEAHGKGGRGYVTLLEPPTPAPA